MPDMQEAQQQIKRMNPLKAHEVALSCMIRQELPALLLHSDQKTQQIHRCSIQDLDVRFDINRRTDLLLIKFNLKF